MGTTRITLNPDNLPIGRIDEARVDATTEEEIALHKTIDEAEARAARRPRPKKSKN